MAHQKCAGMDDSIKVYAVLVLFAWGCIMQFVNGTFDKLPVMRIKYSNSAQLPNLSSHHASRRFHCNGVIVLSTNVIGWHCSFIAPASSFQNTCFNRGFASKKLTISCHLVESISPTNQLASTSRQPSHRQVINC